MAAGCFRPRHWAGRGDFCVEAGGEQLRAIHSNAARSAVAIGKWMDGLELVVGDGHADERVDVAGAVFTVQEPLPVGEQAADSVVAFGGRVDNLGRGVVGEGRAWHSANASPYPKKRNPMPSVASGLKSARTSMSLRAGSKSSRSAEPKRLSRMVPGLGRNRPHVHGRTGWTAARSRKCECIHVGAMPEPYRKKHVWR